MFRCKKTAIFQHFQSFRPGTTVKTAQLAPFVHPADVV